MSITQIECFIAAFDYKSYSEAAKSMYKTPAALTKQVHSLENALDQKLFTQSKGVLQPTSYAMKIYDQSCKALAEYRKVFTLGIEEEAKRVNEIKLAIAAQPFRGNALPPYLEDVFKKEFPHIKLKIFTSLNGECAMAVKNDIAHAAFMMQASSGDLVLIESIYSFKPSIICSSEHKISRSESTHLKNLEGERVAIPIDVGFFYPKLLKALKQSGVKVSFEESGFDLESHKKFIESGGLIFTRPDPRLNKLYPDAKIIRVNDKSLEINVSMVSKNPDSPETKILAKFASSLSEEIAKRRQLKVGSR